MYFLIMAPVSLYQNGVTVKDLEHHDFFFRIFLAELGVLQ